ncbi:hypothetical protein HY621_04215 [Candidatus Uhrbacteria bacterium]|nr:hypothetical protein [Candidatus Uhrbacteria bacterium]
MRFPALWWFIAVAFLMILSNALPYGIAIQNTPPDSLYSGQFFLPSDIPTYYSKMQSGYEGSFFHTNRFTTEIPNPPAPIHLFYTALGSFTRLIGSDVLTVFFSARFFSGLIFLISIFWFCMRVVSERRIALVSFLLASFASGLGWLFFLGNRNLHELLDIYVPAFMPLARFSAVPHVSIASALFVFGLYGVLRYKETFQKRFLVLLTATLFFENIILPYYAIGLYGIIGAYMIFAIILRELSMRQMGRLFFAAGLSFSSFFFMAFVALSNPLWKMSQLEAFVREPPLTGFFIGFGLLTVFAFLEIFVRVKNAQLIRDSRSFLLVSWIVVPLVLAFLPFVPQHSRMFEIPFIVPLAVLSSYFIFRIGKKLFEILVHQIRIIVIGACACAVAFFMILSSWIVIARIPSLLETENVSTMLYIPIELLRASEWIRKNSEPYDAILSSAPVGNMLPFLTSRYVYVGHWSETLHFWDKLDTVQKFYRGEMDDEQVKKLFLDNRIRFVFVTSYERVLGVRGIEQYAWFLKKEFEEGRVTVYRVVLP